MSLERSGSLWGLLCVLPFLVAGAEWPMPLSAPSTKASVASAPSALQVPSAAGVPPGEEVVSVLVSGGSRTLLRLAMPSCGEAPEVCAVAQRDFTLSGLVQWTDAPLPPGGEGKAWHAQADALITGGVQGGLLTLSLFFPNASTPVLTRTYPMPSQEALRGLVHRFDNDVLEKLTGTPGSFGTRLVFSATVSRRIAEPPPLPRVSSPLHTAPRESTRQLAAKHTKAKAVFSIESDGYGLTELLTATSTALAPVADGTGVYYVGSRLDGHHVLYRVGYPAPVLEHTGDLFGVALHGADRVFVMAQRGETSLFLSKGGGPLVPLPYAGLHAHPAFGPKGELAYGSDANGSPNVYVDGRRVSLRAGHNMAPVFCNHPDGSFVVWMGKDGGAWNLFRADPSHPTTLLRLTEQHGSNTYPACSPDGRLLAFFSTAEGGGLFVLSTDGGVPSKIASVTGESLRWQGN